MGNVINATRETPAEAAAENVEGVRLFQAGQYQAAIEAFSAALEIDPRFEAAYRCRAEALRRLGRLEEAHADLLKAEPIKLAWQQVAIEETVEKGSISIPFVATATPVVAASLLSGVRALMLFRPDAPVASFYLFWVAGVGLALIGLVVAIGFSFARKEHVAKEITAGLGVGLGALGLTWLVHMAMPLSDFS